MATPVEQFGVFPDCLSAWIGTFLMTRHLRPSAPKCIAFPCLLHSNSTRDQTLQCAVAVDQRLQVKTKARFGRLLYDLRPGNGTGLLWKE